MDFLQRHLTECYLKDIFFVLLHFILVPCFAQFIGVLFENIFDFFEKKRGNKK